MTNLDQTAAAAGGAIEGNPKQITSYNEAIEPLLLNIDLYIKATLIVAKIRRTRRAERLNKAMRIVLSQVRDTMQAQFQVEAACTVFYDKADHENILADDLGPLAAKIFHGTSLSDKNVAALHNTMLRKQLRIMTAFVADTHKGNPKAALRVLEGLQMLSKQEAAIKEFALDAKKI